MAAVVAEKGQTMRLEVAVAAACIGPRLCHCRLWQRRSLPLLALAAPHRQRPVRTVTLAARVLSVRLSLRRAAVVADLPPFHQQTTRQFRRAAVAVVVVVAGKLPPVRGLVLTLPRLAATAGLVLPARQTPSRACLATTLVAVVVVLRPHGLGQMAAIASAVAVVVAAAA